MHIISFMYHATFIPQLTKCGLVKLSGEIYRTHIGSS